jgi:hypothetical protein
MSLQLALAGISAIGQISAGIAQREEAKLNAFNIKTEKRLNQVQAFQQSRLRRDEYDFATSANLAAFAAMGRDIGSDRSVAAFLERQKEIAGEDIGRIARQSRAEDIAADMRSLAERRRGRNAFYASLFNAAGTIGEGLYQFQQTQATLPPSG